jgi:hypothetical protein
MLDLVCEIDDYESVLWTCAFSEAGEFRIVMRLGSLYARELVRGRIVMPTGDTRRSGIITEVRYAMSGVRESVTAIGYELVHILSWRRVLPTVGCARYEHEGAAETVVKTLVASQCGAYAFPASRRFDRASGTCADLVVAADAGRGECYFLSSRYAMVISEVERCAWATGCGPYIGVDTGARCFVLDVRFGTDRREGQSSNPRALFASAFDTLSQAQLWTSDLAKRNCIIAGGQGSGPERLVVTVCTGEEPRGMHRREEYVDARSCGSQAELTARARARLSENAYEDFFEATVPACSGLVYGEDYFLGDLVTIRAFGETRDARITSVSESRSAGRYDVRLGFDRPYPELSRMTARYRDDTEATLNSAEG